MIPSSRPTSLPSTIPSLQPTTYYGIFNLKSVSPEGQVAVVSFVGLAGVLMILGMIYAIQRKRKSHIYNARLEERNDIETKESFKEGPHEGDLSDGGLSIFHKIRVLGGASVDSYAHQENSEIFEEEDESHGSLDVGGHDVDSLQALPPLFRQHEETEPSTWSMTSEGAVITQEEEHVYEVEHDEISYDHPKSLTSV